MRLLVTGGRTYGVPLVDATPEQVALARAQRDLLRQLLYSLDPLVVIEGAAKGADQLAYEWAREGRVRHCRFRAEWSRYGKFAGLRRNATMLREGKPDVVLAFPGGRGTRDMIDRARKAGVPVLLSSDWVLPAGGI